jgi:methyl-accepting chemotaxis protein
MLNIGLPSLGGMRGRMMLVVAVPLAAFVIAAGAIALALRPVEQAMNGLIATDLPVAIQSDQLRLSVTQTLLHTRSAMLESEPPARDAILAMARDASTRARVARESLAALSLDPEQAAARASAIKAADDFASALGPIWEKLAQNSVLGTDEALELAKTQLPASIASLDAAMEELARKRDLAIERSTAASKANIASIRTTILVAPAIGVVVSAAAGALLASTLVRRTRQVCDRLRDIAAGHGRLETRMISIDDRHELGRIAASFNVFSGSIRDIVSRVDSMTQEVSMATSQIAAATEESSVSMQQQSEQVRQINQAVTQMSQAACEVAEQSTKAAEIARNAGDAAKSGHTVVERTLASMTAIGNTVTEGTRRVKQLGERTQQIGKIIEVIDDIADQTNLLALNAAIEAARAGSHGAGFAVVADEVRKLADRTTDATRQVADSIREIQAETLVAIDQMAAGQTQVECGATNAGEASLSLSKIVKSVEHTASVISSISAAAVEQAAASEQARDSLGQITHAGDSVRQAVSDTAKSAGLLRDKSERLKHELAAFIDDHARAAA